MSDWFYEFHVAGDPLPKGSIDHVTRRYSRDSADRATKTRAAGGLKRWMQFIAWTARASRVEALEGPVSMRLIFHMRRPKSVKRARPTVNPDVDKLARAVLDALEGVAYRNDGQVVELQLAKYYATGAPGVEIAIREAT